VAIDSVAALTPKVELEGRLPHIHGLKEVSIPTGEIARMELRLP
jgi:hypothetical protein